MEYSKQLRELSQVMSTVESILQNEGRRQLRYFELDSFSRMKTSSSMLATLSPCTFLQERFHTNVLDIGFILRLRLDYGTPAIQPGLQQDKTLSDRGGHA
jgi:hypothetical protein